MKYGKQSAEDETEKLSMQRISCKENFVFRVSVHISEEPINGGNSVSGIGGEGVV